MKLTELVDQLQSIANCGYAQYEVDLDIETHELDDIHIDYNNQKVVLLSREVNER